MQKKINEIGLQVYFPFILQINEQKHIRNANTEKITLKENKRLEVLMAPIQMIKVKMDYFAFKQNSYNNVVRKPSAINEVRTYVTRTGLTNTFSKFVFSEFVFVDLIFGFYTLHCVKFHEAIPFS